MSVIPDSAELEEVLVHSAGFQRVEALWQLAQHIQGTNIQRAFTLIWEAYTTYLSLLSSGNPATQTDAHSTMDKEKGLPLLFNTASIGLRSGHFEEAYTALELCLYYSRKEGNREYHVKALSAMGIFALNRTADTVQALEYFAEAQRHIEKGTAAEGFLCMNMSRVAMATGDYPTALEHLHKALPLFRTTSTAEGEIQALQLMGRVYCHTGENEEALRVLLQSLPMQEAHTNKQHVASTYINIGNVYCALDDYTEALNYQIKALCIYEDVGGRQGISTALSNIGNVYNHLGEYESALSYYDQALRHKQQLRERQGEATLLNNMGSVYCKLQQYDKAHLCLASSLELFEICNDRSGIAAALVNTGRAYLLEMHTDKAGHFFQKALAILRDIGEKREEIECLLALGNLSILVHHIPRAFQWLEEALAAATSLHAISYVWQAHHYLAQAYEQTGDAVQALEHYRAFHEIKEKVFNEDSDKRQRVLQLRYKVEEANKEAEMQRLQREQLEQEMEMKNRELTATTMLLAQKNKILQELYEQVRGLRRATGNELTEKIQALALLLEEQLGEQHIWDVFEQHFTHVHSSFYDNLSQLCLHLSPTELKVCALIKLNLSMKESAALLAVTDMTVKKHRYNIRKKLALSEGESLSGFLATL